MNPALKPIWPACTAEPAKGGVAKTPDGRWENVTVLSSIRLDGETESLMFEGSVDRKMFEAYIVERHLVECFFEKLKEFRRVVTRYDKLSIVFKASAMIAACLIWLQ